LLILEDDAYFYLYWGDLAERHSSQVATAGGVLSSEAAAPQAAPKPPPSFLSMDADGRVLRVDTLAKVSTAAGAC
jgi:DNA-binding transcriptional MocR family regulator